MEQGLVHNPRRRRRGGEEGLHAGYDVSREASWLMLPRSFRRRCCLWEERWWMVADGA